MPNSRTFSNHLVDEQSPYLLQHAHNPVDWYPWSPAAFEKARQENKPVLLSVGYSTCHWCHVMAHESFEDEAMARMINTHFVAIKVDREERPDIDHIYMTATTAMTGQGGWPLTVFLTPDAQPFYGGTYFPPQAKWGQPGFMDLLTSIARAWKDDQANILASSRTMTDNLRRHMQANSSTEKMDETLLDRAFRQMRGQFDHANGGFGSAPKFPMGHNLSFLLRYHKRSHDPEALKMVEASLSAMARGGIWDHLGEGFHRYSTDAHWHVPHFEKMLYDQALLARAYLEACQTTGLGEYAKTARGILDFVSREMTDANGGFYSALDADSLEDPADGGAGGHSKEGAFYVFSQMEIEGALGEDAAIFNYCYGVLRQGNASFDPHGEFLGKNILYLAHSSAEAAEHFQRPRDEIEGTLTESRHKLLELRNRRPRPHTDDKVLCDWNGLMLGAFALAGRILNEPPYTAVAVKAADFILDRMMDKECLLHRWRGGHAGIEATLEDHAFLIYGLLELYETNSNDKYLQKAKALADRMAELFCDENGGFFMTASNAQELIVRPKEVYDGAIPSGNSVAALCLLKLHGLTQGQEYLAQARGLFDCFAAAAERAPYAHSVLLSAWQWYLEGTCEITFQGGQDDPEVAKMLKILYKRFIPFKTVKWVSGEPQAQICRQGVCRLPVRDMKAFEEGILAL